MTAITIKDAIEQILQAMCGDNRIEQTCDIIAAGDPSREVTGIVSTFMATYDVLRETVQRGVNFIITHEPTWFTGRDSTDPHHIYQRRSHLRQRC